MADLNLTSIMSLLSGGGVSAISKRTKLSQNEVASVLSAGVPILLTGMQRNSATDDGARSLCGALADHSSADISNVGAFLKDADLKDGKKILGHVLGDDQTAIVERVSEASGVTKGKTTTILALIAPLLLTLLGGQQQQQGSGFNVLSLLGGLLGGGQQQSSSAGLLGALLGGGQQQSGGDLLSGLLGGGTQAVQQQPVQQVQQVLPLQGSQQQASQGGGVLEALGGLGGLSSLFGSSQQAQAQQEEQSGGLLSGILDLFR